MLHIPGLYIAESEGRGRGVFTAFDIAPGNLIELCPVILLSQQDMTALDSTTLYDYYYLQPTQAEEEKAGFIALGYGSLYNHSYENNATIQFNMERAELTVSCKEAIEAGAEILISYTNGERVPLWFEK